LERFIEVKLRYWADFYKMWIEDRRHEDIHIVFYEDIKTDLVKSVLEILRFIGVNPNHERLNCLQKIQNRKFKRKKNKDENQNHFSASQKFLIAKHVKMLNKTLLNNCQKQLPSSYLDFTQFGKISFKPSKFV
jgi:hypothetical protein